MNKIYIKRNCGFFSDFLTSLAGIIYSHDVKKDYYVEWLSDLYGSTNENMFNKYFNQKLKGDEKFDNVYFEVTPYGHYFPQLIGFSGISDKTVYNNLIHASNVLHEHEILNSETFNSIDKNYFKGQKVLGVHKRGTDHYLHGHIINDKDFINEINNEFKNNSYDKIFLITDDLNSLEFFKKEYGDDLIYTNSTKINTKEGIHFSKIVDKKIIAEEVIKDSFLLSLTDYKLITKSNVSTFSLLCNLKENNFRYVDNNITYR